MAASTLTSSARTWWTWVKRRYGTTKYRALIVLLLLVVCMWVLTQWMFAGQYLEWTQTSLPIRDIHAEHFVLGRDQDIYMYSAFFNPREQSNREADSQKAHMDVEIVITTLDRSRVNFKCCIIHSDKKTVFVTRAKNYFVYHVVQLTLTQIIKEYFSPTLFVARQLVCSIPGSSSDLLPSYVTLTSSSCSSDINDYLPILRPPNVPSGLALCAKIAHNGGLDPEKVIEWVEVQRLLGVDKILIFDLGIPRNVNRVFMYYQNLGILDVQPYELPGLPRNRSLQEQWKHTPQFKHDETMAVLECRQRMAGFDFIISHDVDEFIIPRRDVTLKEFLKEQVRKEPSAAGFYFYTEFFITTWTPSNPEEDLMVTRYRRSTVPRWEAYKYVYMPSRVISSVTHQFYPSSNTFTGPIIPPTEAILHHYRECPKDTWGTCSVTTHIDDVMTRYSGLRARVTKVRDATFTEPRWTPVEHTR